MPNYVGVSLAKIHFHHCSAPYHTQDLLTEELSLPSLKSWSKSGAAKLAGWPSIFVSNVFWDAVMPPSLHSVYSCFCAATTEFNYGDRVHVAYKAEIFIICPFTELACQSLI